jgi:REP element-mobilizing transposase RayT
MRQQTLFSMKNTLALFVPEKGRRKSARPLSTRHTIHLILKSKGRTLRKQERAIIRNWKTFGSQFGVRTYGLVVNTDHIHGAIRIHSRDLYRKFITALTGLLSRILQIKWATLPATRIVVWGNDFKRLLKYIKLNEWEALGYINYQPLRTRRLPEWLKL